MVVGLVVEGDVDPTAQWEGGEPRRGLSETAGSILTWGRTGGGRRVRRYYLVINSMLDCIITT